MNCGDIRIGIVGRAFGASSDIDRDRARGGLAHWIMHVLEMNVDNVILSPPSPRGP